MFGAIIAGLAFGVSLIAGFLMLFMLFWYIFYEKHPSLAIFKEKTLYLALFIFLTLTVASIAIYPYGFHLSGDNSINQVKSFYLYLVSLLNFFKPIAVSDPALFLFSLTGFYFLYKNIRKYFWTVFLFIFSYASIFYLIFHYEQRFTSYLFPLLTISAGYGAYSVLAKYPGKTVRILLLILILIPLATSLRLDWLALKNDSRVQAREWIESNIPKGSKIIVHAEMMRLASTKEAISEQKMIDSESLRKIDSAESNFSENPHEYVAMHALNLYSVYSDEFYKNLKKYAVENNYEYLVINRAYDRKYVQKTEGLDSLIGTRTPIKTFGIDQDEFNMRDGNFGTPWKLFQLTSFGPKIEIYKISND